MRQYAEFGTCPGDRASRIRARRRLGYEGEKENMVHHSNPKQKLGLRV